MRLVVGLFLCGLELHVRKNVSLIYWHIPCVDSLIIIYVFEVTGHLFLLLVIFKVGNASGTLDHYTFILKIIDGVFNL